MRVTVCELPHEPELVAAAWAALCEHTARHRSELVLLPEFAFVEPVWAAERFAAARWDAAVAACDGWLRRLPELQAAHVIGARPVTIEGRPFNEGFLAALGGGVVPLRCKYFLPDEPGGWESRWFTRGDREFPSFAAGPLSFGLNICTELWALETYGAYASSGVQAILSPRATAAATTDKWLAVGTVAAVRSGAYCLSSNRVHADGSCGGVSWIISPDGELLARTSSQAPFRTLDIDVAATAAAQRTYPRYAFTAGT
ncbi:MAG TPA: carbon-nitrogen hydrolase family protein [Thermoanaerobaculia bacterium]